jgi:excisionase family DNA binding protein
MPKNNHEPHAEARNNGKPQASPDALAILTVPQTAQYLNCCRRYVENKIRSGELRAYRVGEKFTRIRRRDIDAFLEKHASI